MYRGQYQSKQQTQRKRRRRSRKAETLLCSLILLATMMIGGTLAYLTMETDPVVNSFEPSQVSCTVTEDFNGTTKSNVNVTNTSDIDAYIRVKLVSYRVNSDGKRIGGTAPIPTFTLGAGWVKSGDYYYYTQPVAPGTQPANALISSITLEDEYEDSDGGKQVIEVMAEAIQSAPAKAVGEAWGVTISDGLVTDYSV